MIYFDYTATTPIDKDVLDTYIKMQQHFFANSSSVHKLGQESAHMIEIAKNEIKNTLGIPNHEVIFTSNATEANNLAILGIAHKHKKGKIITTKIEHPSVYEVCRHLEEEGYTVVYLDVDSTGKIDLEQFDKEMTKDVILVSIMWVNNIVGTIQPIEAVIQKMNTFKKAKLHVDAVQGLGKIQPAFDLSEVDLLTFSAHKLHGPKGIGCLFLKENIDVARTLFGSQTQRGIKPGTMDVALPASCAKAIIKFVPQLHKNYQKVEKLRDYLVSRLEMIPNITIHSQKDNCSPYIINVSVTTVPSETLLRTLEAKEIYVSSGSACSSKHRKPEKTIFAMTKNDELATHSIRISLATETKKEEIDELIFVLKTI